MERLLLENETVVVDIGEKSVLIGSAQAEWASPGRLVVIMGENPVEVSLAEWERQGKEVLKAIAGASATRQATRVRCERCHSLTHPEWMFESEASQVICQGCAARYLGVVF